MRGVPPVDIIGLSTSPSTEPFWQAAAEHRLVVPRCTRCGTFRLPPSPFCFHCRAQEVEWIDHDGAGEIYSFTVIRHAVIPQVAEALPFVAAVVELPEPAGAGSSATWSTAIPPTFASASPSPSTGTTYEMVSRYQSSDLVRSASGFPNRRR